MNALHKVKGRHTAPAAKHWNALVLHVKSYEHVVDATLTPSRHNAENDCNITIMSKCNAESIVYELNFLTQTGFEKLVQRAAVV